MSSKKLDSFRVGLNWKGKFEVITCFLGIIMSIFLFLYILVVIMKTEENGIDGYVVLLMPILLSVLCLWRLVHLVTDRVIVKGNMIEIKRAFNHKQEISTDGVISYSNTANNEKGHKFYEISIVFGNNESVEIRNDLYRNFDLLLLYLSKNCKNKEKENI